MHVVQLLLYGSMIYLFCLAYAACTSFEASAWVALAAPLIISGTMIVLVVLDLLIQLIIRKVKA